ncbi:MAG: hypothetical protein CFE38_08195 [Comamonadaceae bacterium PBBC1]|nr:MAG: hypothetical protein CFE38_08195 [Comamonadaceae bacterium PBBC1]
MLLIVGNRGGTNVAESLARSATHLNLAFTFADARDAQSSFRLVNAFCWRFSDRRFARMRAFGVNLIKAAKRDRPTYLLTTGLCPVSTDVLHEMRKLGVVCLHFSTDDPWNSGQRAEWFLRTLSLYDIVFTPRTANMAQFIALGCEQVRYLPFGYDEFIFSLPIVRTKEHAASDVLFVGGADRDRVDFVETLLEDKIPISLVGGYWDRYPSVKAHALGHKTPDELSTLTRSAKVNLCLVRRANRDGHVMRTFEIAALGGCMLVEDTAEHRDIFGLDGECVHYFNGPQQAAAKIRLLLNDQVVRKRLAQAVSERVTAGGHTYTHRLQSMLQAAQSLTSLARV